MTHGRPEDAPYPASSGEQPPPPPRDAPAHAQDLPAALPGTGIPARRATSGRHAGPPEEPADFPTQVLDLTPPPPDPAHRAPDAPTRDAVPAPPDDLTPPQERDHATVGLRRPADLTAPAPALTPVPDTTGGRAARRRAAQGGRGGARRRAGHGGDAPPPPPPRPTGAVDGEVTGGRAARRRAAKAAAKAARQTGTAISNVIGELFITTGAVLLLFVVYQLWWTNVEARAHARHEADSLQEQWETPGDGEGAGDAPDPRAPGAFSPGEGFAILYIPTLDVRVAIAQGVDEEAVLDNGLVGHYTEADGLPTAMPWDEQGNVGLAGHRNTHGEPFRYINQLDPGDPIVIETEDAYFTYEMSSRLDSTSPSNVAVLNAVPEQGGFSEPGRYITLTTCTPEFTSTYRLIVWGELTEERPRSEGKPDALVQ
ncbi:class E sortase [Streptomyces avicenniae]|uniref:class E sortase n=1 Tax=Streptomyces avicenniae TaxID=500153 RepID=UPI000A96E65E|nr:class E sortase [Streptomyces avicenniae]